MGALWAAHLRLMRRKELERGCAFHALVADAAATREAAAAALAAGAARVIESWLLGPFNIRQYNPLNGKKIKNALCPEGNPLKTN